MKKMHNMQQLSEWMKNEIAGKKNERSGMSKKFQEKLDRVNEIVSKTKENEEKNIGMQK